MASNIENTENSNNTAEETSLSVMANDRAGLLTSNEMTEKRKANSNKSLYFDDGVRRIDYILAYQVIAKEDEVDANAKEKNRQTYLQNLRKKGLEIEKAECQQSQKKTPQDEVEDDTHFFKIYAPFEVLCETAEDMNTKMPTAENDIHIRAWYQKNAVYRFFERNDPFLIKDAHIKPSKNYFVAPFDTDRLSEFINHDKPDLFFSDCERARLVYYILEQTRFGDNELDLGIFNLQHNGSFIDGYPLHDGPPLADLDDEPVNDRQRLQSDWATMRRFCKYQPIEGIKEYFGEKVALYFAWLGFYTSFLLPAAIVGVLCFIYGVATAFDYGTVKEICDVASNGTNTFYMCPLCDKLCSYYMLQKEGCMYSKITHFFDNEATLFFALVMSIWATVFLEFWKRKQVSLAYEWHTMDFEEEEQRPRPEYLAQITKLKKNPVTLKMEPYMPARQRATRLMGAFGVVFFFILLVLIAVFSVIIFRAAFYVFLIGQDVEAIRSRSKIVVSACAACINLIVINFLKFFYQRIALWLTKWENPRTNTDYEDSFTVKMFWFQFVNTYSSIFYVAFFKSEYFTGSPGKYRRFTSAQFRFDGCSVQGCFLELTVQLVIIMVGQQIIGNTMEILIPYLKNKFNDFRNRKKQVSLPSGDEPQWVTDLECQMQTRFSLFWQYLEIVLQYGFVTMFVAAFPLAPFFALLNNLVEIRLDAVNFIHNFRRPAAERAEDIGAWYGILATLTTFSTIVNAFVLAFTSELIPRLVYKYKYSPDGSMYGFTDFSLSRFNVTDFKDSSRPENATLNVAVPEQFCRYPGYHIDHNPYTRNQEYWVILSARLAFILSFIVVVIGIKWVIGYLIPDMPKNLELKIKRERYLAGKADKEHKESSGKRKKRTSREPQEGASFKKNNNATGAGVSADYAPVATTMI